MKYRTKSRDVNLYNIQCAMILKLPILLADNACRI